jgi:dihydroorotase
MSAAGARMFSDDGIPIDDEVVLSNALHRAREHGYAIALHEEDRTLTANRAMNAGEASKLLGVAGMPASAETARIRRDLAIAMGAGAAVHIAHASLAESLALVRAARSRGAQVTCEVTPHHFTLDDRAVLEWGPNARMMPPLRAPEDVAALQAGLADGTVDMIATDHAPHDPVSKAMDRIGARFGPGRVTSELSAEEAEALSCSANGIVGLETALGLALQIVHRGMITPTRLVELMSLNPARLLRLEGHGTLVVGERADITLIDANREWTVEPGKFLSRSRNTPFAGMTLRGKAMVTMVGGEIVYDGRGGGGRP